MQATDMKSLFPSIHATEKPASAGSGGRPKQLSVRETTILRWLALGKSAQEVAQILGISVNTVRAHIRSIIRKMGVANIAHAVAEGFRRSIL